MSGDWHSTATYIMFRDEMVRRILSGQKTETRWLRWMEGVNCSPWFEAITSHELSEERGLVSFYAGSFEPVAAVKLAFHPGQILNVRESWMQVDKEKFIRYKADGAVIDWRGETPRALDVEEAAQFTGPEGVGWKYMSSRAMPRSYTRLRLVITEVAVQHLHEITSREALNEGALLDEYSGQLKALPAARGPGEEQKKKIASRKIIYKASDYPNLEPTIARFAALWDSIQGTEPTKAWAHNPYTWRIRFSIKQKLP